MSIFITIVDPLGAAYYDGTPVPVSHRIEWDGKQFHGTESLLGLFGTKAKTEQCLRGCLVPLSGSFDQLSWERS